MSSIFKLKKELLALRLPLLFGLTLFWMISLSPLATKAQAQTVGVTFSAVTNPPFNTLGPAQHSLFACNAGFMNLHGDGLIYQDILTGQPISWTQCQAESNTCKIVSSTASQNDNTLTATYTPWDGGNLQSQSIPSNSNPPIGALVRLFQTTGPGNQSRQGWRFQLQSLKFDFSSAQTGVLFFVDVCYYGPNINFHSTYPATNNNNQMPIRWEFTSQVHVAPTGDGRLPYIASHSPVSVQSFMACDLQGQGQWTANPNYNNLQRDLDEDLLINGPLGGFSSSDRFYNSNEAFLPSLGSLPLWVNLPITNSLSVVRAVRYCKIRYVFREQAGVRPGQSTGSNITLTTIVNRVSNP